MKVVFVIADSLRADAPGYAGGAAETPFLDSLAASGAWFKEAFASGAWTIPSILSMLTGALPHKIGVARWRHPFPRRRPTLLTAFADAGFEVRTFHPYPEWGFIDTPGAGIVGNSQEPQAVIDALRGGARDSLFLIHHWWTHVPYLDRHLTLEQWHAATNFTLESLNRHPARIAASVERSYRRSVGYFSESLLPRYMEAAAAGGGDVLLVVTGDHGETWGRSLPEGRRIENVYDLHGRWITDETIRIPLLVSGRGARGAIPVCAAIPGIARGADVGATIAEVAGVPWPGGAPSLGGREVYETGIGTAGKGLDLVGTSLAAALQDGGSAPHEEIVTVTSQNAYVPRTYPDTGKATWRTFGLRDRRGWFVWDGVDGTREIAPSGAGEIVPGVEQDAVWKRLEALWNDAEDPGTLIPDEDLARLRGVAPEERAQAEERLRTLGYLD
jgi:hypothetical protein